MHGFVSEVKFDSGSMFPCPIDATASVQKIQIFLKLCSLFLSSDLLEYGESVLLMPKLFTTLDLERWMT